jgi:hypothetical protein
MLRTGLMLLGGVGVIGAVVAAVAFVGRNPSPFPPGFEEARSGYPFAEVYYPPMEAGWRFLRKGDHAEAIVSFRQASIVHLFEDPNYDAWLGLAEAYCRAGGKADGREMLNEFKCAEDISNNRLECTALEVSELKPRSGPGFPHMCHREMCAGEIVRGYFEGEPNGSYARDSAERARVQLRQSYVSEVARLCGG